MFEADYDAMAKGAVGKASFLQKNPLGYFTASALAGAYIGFGILLSFTVSGTLAGLPAAKMAMGASFGIALSLVVIAGAELFTGNNMVMAAGVLKKTTTMADLVKLWIICYIGNWIGAIVLSLLFWGAQGMTGATATALLGAASMKMSLPPLALFLRGILCNVLVCLAVWCGFRCKSDAGKLIMVWWCLYAFFTCGFEHSVANMTVLTLSLLEPGTAAVSLGGYFYNLVFVTLGNIVGGALFIALPYYLTTNRDA